MAQVQVVAKTGNIDGQTINWSVLSIVGFAGGEIQTLELKLSKTEAMLARILLSNEENVPTQSSRPANAEEKKTFDSKNKTILDDDEEGEGFFS